MIKIKRVYEEPSTGDGMRILVDRVWPRGTSRGRARRGGGGKDRAPSTPPRKWWGHDPAKWKGFRHRYRGELNRSGKSAALKDLAKLSRRKTATLVYGAADEK